MMLTILGLPPPIKYADIKSLIKQQCNLTDFVLDNLKSDQWGTKRVTIAVSEHREASHLIKCLDGFNMAGSKLQVQFMDKTQMSMSQPQMSQQNQSNMYGNSQANWPTLNLQPPTAVINKNMYQGPDTQGYGQPMSKPERPHVLRSVEVVDSPMTRGNQRYPEMGYEAPQKPITIKHDNFQGPAYNMNRPNQSVPYQSQPSQLHYEPHGQMGQSYGPSGHGPSIHGSTHMQSGPNHGQPGFGSQGHGPSSMPQNHGSMNVNQPQWNQQTQPDRYAKQAPEYDRKYPEPDKPMNKVLLERNPDYNKPYDKPGPRFSPRREKDGPRFSPRKEAQRFSPRREIETRFSPGRDKDSYRFSKRDTKIGPRFSPRSEVNEGGPRLSPRRDIKATTGPRFSPRRDVKGVPGPRFSPRRDVKEVAGPRFSPRRDAKDAPGPRFSPRRDFDSRGQGGRMPSPGRRISPGRGVPHGGPLIPDKRFGGDLPRRASPPRQHGARHSPPRQFDKNKYTDSQRKDIRPAYEHDKQAPNQAMYSGGYRPNVPDTQYPIPGFRPQESVRQPTWEQDKPYPKKEDIRDSRMPKFEPRIGDGKRKSRSPMRRDRSPRERFRKHSPSPKSPRRSWALEKRHSPDIRDAPPPPVWPGQGREPEQFRNRGFPDKVERIQKQPVWERPAFEEKPRERIDVEDRRFSDKGRVDAPRFQQREPSPRSHGFKTDDRFPRSTDLSRERDPKFDPKYENERRDKPDFRPKEIPVDTRRRDFTRPEDIVINKPEEFNKEFDDIYKRATEFNKRAKELRKTDDRKGFSEERHRDEKDFGKFRDNVGDRHRDGPVEGYHRDMRPEPHRDIPRHDLIQNPPRTDERRDIPFRQVSPRRDDRMEPRHVEPRLEPRHMEPRVMEPKHLEPRHVEPRHEPRRMEPRRVEPRNEDRRPSPRRHENQQYKPPLQTEDSRFKRERAVDEISNKLMDKHGSHLSSDLKPRVLEELKIAVNRIFKDIFGHKEVSFIELVVKFQAQFNDQDERKLFEEVIVHLPGNLRKRVAEGSANPVPAKVPRMMERGMNQDLHEVMPREDVSDWNKQISQIAISKMGSMFDVTPEMMGDMGVAVDPANFNMVPNPFGMEQFSVPQFQVPAPEMMPDPQIDNNGQDGPDGYNLYLCKDDFEPYSSVQAEYLKNFLVAQMIKTTGHVHGWAPDFTIKGLQSVFRYELTARDDDTRRWILDLNFSEFKYFNVIVYNKEELWFERGAVWLPGHTRNHNLTPFAKLKLQNQKLEGVNIDNWKFVKQVVTLKGTRVYVDMPPSSARALEKHNLSLSYELQKVNVFLKAMAVDKQSFDNGLREYSIADELANSENVPMPSISNEPDLIKIGLKGDKPLTVEQAGKVKDIIVNRIFKYHQSKNAIGRTDFLKYGYCLPGYFSVVPQNNETRRWLLNLNLGTLKKHPLVIIGGDDDTKKMIRVTASIRTRTSGVGSQVVEKIKKDNTGVKGLNFNMWKVKKFQPDSYSTRLYLDMDIDSVESLAKVNYKLDYIDGKKIYDVSIRYDGRRTLEEVFRSLKDESKDSYDVANMDIASDDSDDEIIYMGTA